MPTSVPDALLKLGATSTMLPRFLTSVRIFNAPVSFVQFAISSILFSQTYSRVKSSFCGLFCSQCIFGSPINCVLLTIVTLNLKSSLPPYYTALITLVANREYTPLPSAECHSMQLPYPFVGTQTRSHVKSSFYHQSISVHNESRIYIHCFRNT